MDTPLTPCNAKITIISALEKVLRRARRSHLDDQFWEDCKVPLEFLSKKLGLSAPQVVFLAVLIENENPQSWKNFSNFFETTRLSIMIYSDELEDLVDKRWIEPSYTMGMERAKAFKLCAGVITAIRHNETFIPEKIDGLSLTEFISKIYTYRFDCNGMDSIGHRLEQLYNANRHLPLCESLLALNDTISLIVFSNFLYDYARNGGKPHEGLDMDFFNMQYPDTLEYLDMRYQLANGTHILIEKGFIEYKCEDGIVDDNTFVISSETKRNLLADFSFMKSSWRSSKTFSHLLKSWSEITTKPLYYNDSEKGQIERLESMLSQENLPGLQQRLAEQGMRKGFACLFYGAPGTGKTETVLQLARKTGRDIMQIDIAGLRDKWVGESEKNIKEVFTRYREICRTSDVMPILFFNEADGIINKRIENVAHSVDKMDNAMQNIILQEIENLDGILIATTNLTSNLDPAFDRRFLFKVEFKKPETSIKAKIWSGMIRTLSDDQAFYLASRYDFSGGQIENIARKSTIDYILNGKYCNIDDIESFCKQELLNDNKYKMQQVGFHTVA